ncbi:serine/threonine-protein kinase [Phycicoccus endophyticus]|uniref:serine/threonine-protein kinase n=1 Tax=Phycicoccus endophyticus TaxID=1690220 RepID=UPI0016685EE6|nr:serine/threonine-protein kinase [Phycicoccus endophyticus]
METTGVPTVPGIELGPLLGRGANSEVWEGVALADGRRVAVKVTGGDPEAAEAAVREAEVSARVALEHVLAVQACLPLPGGRVALVMPLMRGGSLAALVRARGHLSPGEVVTVLAPLAGALGRLHGAGVVHGDVSPGNVLLDLQGRPVLADLGLGRLVGEAPGAVWGTPGHLAPELLLGADPAPATDVYALGALGWLALAGEVPDAPGLRPALAEVSRAGAGSEQLVAVLEEALCPEASQRPGADELAGRLFAAARPEALRLVVGGDEATAVTYRLRAAAGRPPRPEAAPGAPRGHSGRHRRGRRPAATGARPGRRALGVAGALVVPALLALGLATAAAVRAPEPPVPRPSPASSSASPVRSPPASRSPAASVSAPADPRVGASAPTEHPALLLGALAEARAAAFRRADAARLEGAETPGGPLHARDAAALAQLSSAGLRYAGLHYRVRDVTVFEAGARAAVLRARIATSAYRVAAAGRRSPRAAGRAQRVRVELRRTGAGWRVQAIRAG